MLWRLCLAPLATSRSIARPAAPRLALMSKRARSTAAEPPTVVVVSPPDGPAFKDAPLGRAEMLIGNDMPTLLGHGERLQRAEALLWIPPGSVDVLAELIKGGHLPNLKWCHGFYAGVHQGHTQCTAHAVHLPSVHC